jgi:hypothetical protein
MCGRLDQNDISRILANFDWVDEVLNRSRAPPRWNVPPGTYRPVLHLEAGQPSLTTSSGVTGQPGGGRDAGAA